MIIHTMEFIVSSKKHKSELLMGLRRDTRERLNTGRVQYES